MFRESRVRILFAEWLFRKKNYISANNNNENNRRNKTIYELRVIMEAPWYVPNAVIIRDLTL